MENLAINEEWRPVVGYEGYYEVSNYGNVRSVPRFRNKGTLLKPSLDSHGYFMADLWKNNQRKKIGVHRLVGMAFIPNPENLPYINHKDENPKNNFIGNLEWCTHEYNLNYGTCRARMSEKAKISNHLRPLQQYNRDGSFVAEFPSIIEAERQLNIDACSILYCCNHNGVRSLPGGFQWKYKDSDKVIQSMSSIAQFDLDGNRIAVFNTIADAARNTGIRGELIRRCIIDSSKTAGGYKWNKI